MSNAMNYLLAARPEAMTAYFTFLKKSGDHLDTKTRDLISVITKVAVQTEGGFRQYLTRALRNGATPNEVIDALLMAFPVLGLAKIVWATDILLEMDIPDFRPEALLAEAQWHDIADLDEIKLEDTTWLEVEGRHLFIYRDETDIRVYDSRCPHQVTDIPHLSLEGTKLTCPKHQWAFDVVSGECVEKGKHPLRRFEHKVEAGRLLAFW
ncbi:MAG: Rieske 2Fe-2S domain-containing protein [gamma proteobacterium endosymbiont of Lamellibrachia anaximandri]|nr:Rieske 2Fe-2S domain-containing protein [gamma proteobacterium endosymbiont of Lamellibrachia anaximandri]MBL3533711.1 Rieske 2Fe-2S domain-containing protein [gamma proteobacterium endosymbiont of Lamellibrachia anaximandri]